MVEGITQVYSADYRLSQCIEAHCTAFVNKQLEGNLYESIVMCAASRMLESHIGKVCLLVCDIKDDAVRLKKNHRTQCLCSPCTCVIKLTSDSMHAANL